MCPAVRVAAVLTLLTATALSAADDVATTHIRAHVTFLADDLLEGRGTGTRGHELAARYVASQFVRLGVEPAADGGMYEQPVKLIESVSNYAAGRLMVRAGDKEDALTPVNDMMVTLAPGKTADTITAPAIFVGFGIQAPDLQHDDFAGADLHGKIAVMLSGAPKRFPSEQRAHHGNTDQKRALLVKHGAIGVVTIITPWDEVRRPWAMTVALSRFPTMRLVDDEGGLVNGFPQLRALGSVANAAAGRILIGAPKSLSEIFATAERGEPQNFPLGVTITLAGEASIRRAESLNVLGRLSGTDPALAGQPLVITGHLDHLGIGTAVNGDTIYNGAVDNALGIGVLLQVAEELAHGPRLRRPVLFAAVTGEEKGLLGSHRLATHPPAWVHRCIASLNIDMPLLSAPARDLIAYGYRNSTLGAVLDKVAARHGLVVSPDPAP
ncbi:MAG: hypothetical protein QG602_2564, partial [Verrucomicrobiota bacterium]|nr:hypothetical protein [Verrucomicrobiota bacterium]